MKRTLLVSLALFLAAFLIPLLTTGQSNPPGQALEEAEETPLPPVESPVAEPPASPSSLPPPEKTAITVLVNGTPAEIDLQEYLYGSVAAEMPALYPEEALKAQAVAIRTFVAHAMEVPYHENALVCAEWECCLAYAPLSSRAGDWGEGYEEWSQKIIAAVDETDGVVITYEGELIEAVFFAATDGRTRSAAEVWGGEVPYLQSVDSAFDKEFPNGPRGHGVGMSQFGARQLALQGLTYEEILQWYYTGVEVA
ncbi:MAG: SpoIID/LytB domain-containing protein [Oscillospiraceae bacterium]|nr:SpoIID/LytB domain-containing protein [Oscillospiraceae bacterium]